MNSVESEVGKVAASIEALSDEIIETKGQLNDAQKAGNKEAVRLWLQRLTALDQQKNLLLEKEARLQSAVDLSKDRSDDDRSDEYVKQHLLTEPTPTLPQSRNALDASLKSSTSIKLPVTAQCYKRVSAESPTLAKQCLVSTDGSHLPAFLSHYILESPSSASTEMSVTLFVSPALQAVFNLLDKFSGLRLNCKLTFNAAEADTSSRAVAVGKRPDTLGMANSCTFLMGEDKKRKLEEGINDLRRKKRKLSRMHYGDVPFIIGYAAAEARFRWFWLGSDEADVQEVGEELDIGKLVDRVTLLQNMVFVYRLVVQMARTVPQMTGRLPLFEKLERHSGGTVLILDNGVRKSIPDFERYSKDYETSFDAVKRAYAAAKAAAKEAAAQGRQPFVITATTGPQLEGRRKTYLVETTPLGYYKEPSTVREARALALACCETARVLHAEGVVHRDFRLPNVVCLGPRTSDEDSPGTESEVGASGGNDEDLAFLVIDLEGAAEEGAEVTPDCGLALASRDGVLDENGRFTAASDMFEIGMLLQPILRKLGAYHGESKAFVQALKRKELSALQALDHPWLRGLGN